MATQLGRPVSFGFTGSDGISGSLFTGKIILQSADYESASDKEEIRSAAGEIVTETFYNQSKKANLEYIPTASSIAGVTANVTLPSIPTFVAIDTCVDMPVLAGVSWVYKGGGKITKSNTGAAKISLPIEALTNITVAAS